LIRQQFDIAAFNAPAEQFERAAGLRLNLSAVLGAGAELFCVQQDFVDAGRWRFEIHFLVDGCAVLLGLSPSRNGREPSEHETDLAASCFIHA